MYYTLLCTILHGRGDIGARIVRGEAKPPSRSWRLSRAILRGTAFFAHNTRKAARLVLEVRQSGVRRPVRTVRAGNAYKSELQSRFYMHFCS